MPLQVLLADEFDAPRVAQIEHAAYADKPMDKVLFPGIPPEEAIASRTAGLAKELREDPTVRWIKVVDNSIPKDDSNEQLIGFAQWNFRLNGEQLPPRRDYTGSGFNTEACNAVFNGAYAMRARVLGDGKHVHLRLCFVHPKAQRRGAGKLLVDWGLAQATKLGLPAYIMASEEGYSLYKKCGFEDVEREVVDCTKWGVNEPFVTIAMKKEA
ncbi:acyl-CoA N-acyltransferase [Xylariaceae sp. FL1272]|nr:acyl-CoA N-acyltransferase [Xylariaceae sp. FL1272]